MSFDKRLFLYLYVARSRRRKSRKRILIGYALLLLFAVLAYREWQKINASSSALDLRELPEGFVSYGIDISHHQGKIDWEASFTALDSLVSFVYCKATEGVNHVDSQWERNREQLIAHKVLHGAYHFFLPQKDPALQAKHFLSHYKPLQDDLPPVLDAEIEVISNKKLVKDMLIWLKMVEQETGKRPVIYTSHNLYRTVLKEAFVDYKFWIANYNKNVSGLEDEQIIHWQYSDKGEIPGIQGNVDLNFSKIEFR